MSSPREPDPLRVVVDTNVLVSALLQPQGPPGAVLRAWQSGRIQLIVCPELLAELSDVLDRPKLRRHIEERAARGLVSLLRSQGELRADPIAPPPATRDAKDDYVVALARAVRADFIVTGDRDILEAEPAWPGAISPSDLLDELERPG